MEVVKLRTFYLCPTLSDENIDSYNASNSVIVSQALFQEISEKDTTGRVAIIGLYYKNKKIYVDMIDSHNEDPNVMYIPSWIYNHFDYQEDDVVNYMQVFPKLGNKIKIKPIGDFYTYLDDPINSLRNGFEKYSCLIENTTILVNVDSMQIEIEILETYINSEKNKKNQPICIRGVELEVDIEEVLPVPAPEPIYNPIEQNINIQDDNIDFSCMFSKTYMKKIIDEASTRTRTRY